MAGVYRLKNCPKCGVEHRKRGQFCSQSCANQRAVSEEKKEVLRDRNLDYAQTPEGLATAAMVTRQNEKRAIDNEKKRKGEYILQEDDWYVEIPDFDSDGTENIKW
jgi:hypothetical protein